MKWIMSIIMLLALQSTSLGLHSNRYLEGRWINPYSGQEIRIDSRRQDIRVRGLTRRGWATFRQIDVGLFSDRQGNLIDVRSVDHLVAIPSRGGGARLFVNRRTIRSGHTCDRSCNRSRHTHQYDDRRRERGAEYYLDDDRDRRRRSRIREGQYLAREYDMIVQVEITSDGLRARRQGGSWTYYIQSVRDPDLYEDASGNTYKVEDNRYLKWRSQRGDVINLEWRRGDSNW